MNWISFARTERHAISNWWWTVDRTLLTALLILIGIGIALVMAASPPVAERIGASGMHFVIRHFIFLAPTILLLLSLSFLNERQIWRVATYVLFTMFIMMIIVLFIGDEIKGAQRWIHFPGFSLQPSELAKPAFAVFAAWLFSQKKENPLFPGDILAALVYCILVILLLLQPDFGMTIVTTAMFATQIFLAGLRFRYLIGFIGMCVCGIILAYYGIAHVQSRIDRFLDPASGDTYQVQRSIDAIKYGGALGTGPGQGVMTSRIPDAHADFIFSVGAEEYGFGFVLALLLLYGYIIWRVLRHLYATQSLFTILSCSALLTMFGLQALVHIGSAMQVLPTKGMTLPFISYGGSSMIAFGFSFGIILGLTRRHSKTSAARMGLSARPLSPTNEKNDPQDFLI